MSFTAASIFAGFVFGVLGVFLIKQGRNRAAPPLVLIGVILCVIPYFIPSALLLWLTGLSLLAVAYRLA